MAAVDFVGPPTDSIVAVDLVGTIGFAGFLTDFDFVAAVTDFVGPADFAAADLVGFVGCATDFFVAVDFAGFPTDSFIAVDLVGTIGFAGFPTDFDFVAVITAFVGPADFVAVITDLIDLSAEFASTWSAPSISPAS